ncbi:hypothetical protein OC844_004978 [Tilletia horrida]|nr:hypothetical protein OC844_004978 [Tilletia horrida]
MPATRRTRSTHSRAHWRSNHKDDIDTLREKHADELGSLANRAGVKVYTVRRFFDQTFTKHKKLNSWNIYLAWARRNPTSEFAPKAGQTAKQAYKNLPFAAQRDMRKWWDKRVLSLRSGDVDGDDDDPKDVVRDYNKQCRELLNHINFLQMRFGIVVAAVVSHPLMGVSPFLATGDESGVALAGAMAVIKEGKTVDDLTLSFDAAVKNQVWKNPLLEGGRNAAPGSAFLVPKQPKLSRSQALSHRLIKLIHSVVRGAAERKGETVIACWNKATKKGTRIRYQQFFSLVAASGCYVDGWPTSAGEIVQGNFDETIPPTHGPVPTTFTVWRGSLKNTSHWRVPVIEALEEAIDAGTLSVRTAPSPPSSDSARGGQGSNELSS